MENHDDVTIVIITALPYEFAAIRMVLDDASLIQDGMVVGSIRDSAGQVRHRVAAAVLSHIGPLAAATSVLALNFLERFPNVEVVVMVGIAGGIPRHEKPDKHVRLGDVVCVGAQGVLQHDVGKQLSDGFQLADRGGLGSPKTAAVVVAQSLLSDYELDEDPIGAVFDGRFSNGDRWKRPDEAEDELHDDVGEKVEHPADPDRTSGTPRLHIGRVASGSSVIKSSEHRAWMRDRDVVAVEMEGSGIASAVQGAKKEYFIIRGVVDYCDEFKNDKWHRYGAAVAACAMRAVLERLGPADGRRGDTGEPDRPNSSTPQLGGDHDSLRGQVVEAVQTARETRAGPASRVEAWQAAHTDLNRSPFVFNTEGEPLPAFLSEGQVRDLLSRLQVALREAHEQVESRTTKAATTIETLILPNSEDLVSQWAERLVYDLGVMTSFAGQWPGPESRNRLEPPPLEDGGQLDDAIAQVQVSLAQMTQALAGEEVDPPILQEPLSPVEPTELEQTLDRLNTLSNDLLPFARVDTRPYDEGAYKEAVEVGLETLPLSLTKSVGFGLPDYYQLAACVARNADDDTFQALVDEAGQLEPLPHRVQILRQLTWIGHQSDRADRVGLAMAGLAEAFEAGNALSLDDSWAVGADAVRRLLEVWAMVDAASAAAALTELARDSPSGLCRALALVADEIQQTDRFTGDVSFVREISARPGLGLPPYLDAKALVAAVAFHMPEASALDRWESRSVEDDCDRFAAQFLHAYGGD